LNKTLESGVRDIVFVIGGAMGLDESVTGRAHKTIAMSRWTFTHEMARLVLLEQLYRAFTIIKGKTYHY
jgi:23S rRNA (pseudouridine1915-N3)-methyltransferase